MDTRFRKPFTVLVAAGAMLAAGLMAATPALARDRPGTPNEERAEACGDALLQQPMICAQFNNTATEKVRFEMLIRVNGEDVQQKTLEAEGARFTCRGEARKYGCAVVTGSATEGLTSTANGRREQLPVAVQFSRDLKRAFSFGDPHHRDWYPDDPGIRYVPPQGLRVQDARPGDEYCFAFRARRVSDQVVSARWSNWTCAQARALPPKPQAPSHLGARFLESNWDSAGDGRQLPHRLDLSWDPASNAGEYIVRTPERTVTDKLFQGVKVPRSSCCGFHVEMPLKVVQAGGVPIMVCARNVSGMSCTQTLLANLVDPASAKLKRERGGAVDAIRAASGAVPAPEQGADATVAARPSGGSTAAHALFGR